MASRIPREIVDLIVEGLFEQDPASEKAALQSCCLVGKIFVPACQKRLFQEVVLQPATFATSASESIEGPDYTLRFSQLLQNSPHLADYVSQLTYRFANEGTLNKCVEETLKKLRHFTILELQVEDTLQRGYTDFFGWSLSTTGLEQSQHAQAVLSLIQQPQLRKLILRSLELPIDALEPCFQLQIVELHDSTCFYIDEHKRSCFLNSSLETDGGDGDDETNGESQEEVIFLKPIYLEKLSLHGLDTPLFLDEIFTNPNFNRLEKRMAVKFRRLRSLEVPVTENHLTITSSPQQPTDVCQVLLSRTECLEELHLYSMRPVSDATSPTSNRLECPLKSLHPASFSTLRRLSYSISIFEQVGALRILDPYHGLLREDGRALKQLVSLEDLTIAIWISRDDMHWQFITPFFGDGWGALYNALKLSPASTYPCEKLKSLTVTVGASLLTEHQDPKLHLLMFRDQILLRHLGELKTLAESRGILLKLDTPVRIEEHPLYN